MRLLFIRHGDPDYINDTLTEKGHREAKALSLRAKDLQMGSCFVSPLGRAQDTAAYCVNELGISAHTFSWLEEFPAQIDLNKAEHLVRAYPNAERRNGVYEPRIVWDVAPSYWMDQRDCMDSTGWRTCDICQNSDTVEVYDRVVGAFDELLCEKGYRREGGVYRVEKESTQTLTFFCHFGVTCALLSHLWGQSPFALWHSLALAPTSVTEVVTEERQKGYASFRGLKLGDVSHLVMAGEEPSFAARFCEIYSDMSQRH